MLDADECRDNARRCLEQAAEMSDPVLKQCFVEIAQNWERLAADYASLQDRIPRRPAMKRIA